MIPAILPLYDRADINFSHGEGVYLYSNSGKQYLDFAAGYAAMAFGHCHPRLVKALTEQAKKGWHLSNRYTIPGLEELSQKLVDISFADTVFVANTGAEAVECMIKMTRCYFKHIGKPHKYRIITFEGAFHGRTLATATAGAAEKIVGFEPAVDGFDRVKWHDINAVRAAIGENTAGILIEPIQGEGGIRDHSDAYMQELEAICREHGLLLMLDEIQCGMGRTGNMFAYQGSGVTPDLMALGKGLGSGFPISACLTTEEVGHAMKTGSHGSTYGGNPLATAVGNEVMDMMAESWFLENVNRVGNHLRKSVDELAAQHSGKIIGISGKGLMLGIKLTEGISLDKLSIACREQLLLSIPAAQNVMRLTPPLIINEQQVDEAISKFDKALRSL